MTGETPRKASDVMSETMEKRLRELASRRHKPRTIGFDWAIEDMRRAAAIARNEALEEAAKYVQSCRETGNMEDTVQVFDVLAESIRSLKTPGEQRRDE